MYWPSVDTRLIFQTDDVVASCCETANDSNQQHNVRFDDEVAGHDMNIRANLSIGNMDSSTNSSLADFLSRPVSIFNDTWTEALVYSNSLQPWHLFFNNAAIKKKLDNYYMLRCNLKIKLVINASPFYYGMLQTSYQPLSDGAGNGYDPCPLNGGGTLLPIEYMGKSQRPHFYSYPQTCQGGEMTLPFFYNKQWLDVTVANDLKEMGYLSLFSLTTLKNANGVSGDAISIQIYAWAEDVELAGPTCDLALQTEDEYAQDGIISGPASALARFAGKTNIAADALAGVTNGMSLLIKPFATATSLVATAIGSAAQLFGFTNVPVLADVHAMKGQPFPQLASTQIGTPVEKLTLDSKNELCVDAASMGVDSNDELLISNIVSRESFIDNFVWAATDTTDTLLWNVN